MSSQEKLRNLLGKQKRGVGVSNNVMAILIWGPSMTSCVCTCVSEKTRGTTHALAKCWLLSEATATEITQFSFLTRVWLVFLVLLESTILSSSQAATDTGQVSQLRVVLLSQQQTSYFSAPVGTSGKGSTGMGVLQEGGGEETGRVAPQINDFQVKAD